MSPDPFTSPAPPAPSSLTFSALLGRLSGVEAEGDGYRAACPAHADRSPSLRVAFNAERGSVLLHCRAGCTIHAVTAALSITVADLFQVAPGDAAVTLATVGRQSGPLSVEDRDALSIYASRAAEALRDASVPASSALAYAARRFGISEARAAELGLGVDDGTLHAEGLRLSAARYHDTTRLVVPFKDFRGNVHYVQSRDVDGSSDVRWSGPMNPEGALWGRYGVFSGSTGWGDVVVTEGPGDALTAASAGFDAVAVRGAALGANASLADEIASGVRGRRVVVVGDADASGVTFAREVCEALAARGVQVCRLTLPEGVGDVSDWLRVQGAAFPRAFVAAVQEAPRFGPDQIVAEEVLQEVTRLFSDVFNARALLDIIREDGGDVRHVPEVGWVIYRPARGTWEVDVSEWTRSQAHRVAPAIQSQIMGRLQGMNSRATTISDPTIRETVARNVDQALRSARSGKLISYVMSSRGIDNMLRELQVLPTVFAEFDDFDRHENLLAVSNGVVDLETGSLTPYSEATRALLLMRRVDTAYRPDACNPRWERFLEEVFADHDGQDLPAFMRRLVGYGITGSTSEQILAVMHGDGANGKGVFIETLTSVLGGISQTTPFNTFESKPSGGIPNDVAALKGSRLVMASEGEQGRHFAEALVKRLTGGDTITARFMRKEFFSFKPTFLILLATNHKPVIRGQDRGIWRRIRLIPFTRSFSGPEMDRYLVAKLTGARVPAGAWRPGDDVGDGPEGILSWAVAGAVEWYREGLQAPPVVLGATDAYRQAEDNLGDFLAQYLYRDEDARISGKEVFELYLTWCDEENLQPKDRWKRSTFFAALEERGGHKFRPGGTVHFQGYRKRRPSDPSPM